MNCLIRRAPTFARALLICLFTLAISASPPAQAQTPGFTVTGTIVAADGTPISDATVTLAEPGVSLTATTDVNGRFVMHGVAPGTYRIRAGAPGYATTSDRTATVRNADTALTLELPRATTNSLTVIGQVRVAANETVSTSSAPTVLLNAQNAAAAGVPAVSDMVWNQLSTTPVLPMGGGSNATVSFALRGPDPTETLIDIDGHQVNNGNTGDFDLSLVDPAAMQDVQLVYGISPSSLVGPNTLGGAINILTLEPTTTPQTIVRGFGGSFGTLGETVQTTGTNGALGYAVSLHQVTSNGSVNQSVFDSGTGTTTNVGGAYSGQSAISKIRYQLGGPTGYGYLQLDFRNQSIDKDESALLTTFTPNGFTGSGGDDAIRQFDALPMDESAENGTFQSGAGTTLDTNQANYGFDGQVPVGGAKLNGVPATMLAFSHLTTLASQSVTGPLADSLPYLYNQRDLLGDDWIEFDHYFRTGELSFKYDLGTESLTTDYVQGQVTAESTRSDPFPPAFPRVTMDDSGSGGDDQTPPTEVIPIGQVQRSAVLRYNGDPTSHIHYSLATYFSNYSTFGTSFDPRAGFVWTPTGNTAVRASVGTTFQTPQLSELVVPPPSAQVPIGGIIFTGNPNLQPDRATEYDLGAQQIFGSLGHQGSVSLDLYQTNLRNPSSQLNVEPNPGCGDESDPCPVSYPVNAGDAVYRGIQIHADRQLGPNFRLRAGWDVDSSYLTSIPPEIQDGSLLLYEQSLGQPLHKAFLGFDQVDPRSHLTFGADLDYEGTYNELNRSPYATLTAQVVWNVNGLQLGLYGTNLTNVYSNPFTIVGGGILYGGAPGTPPVNTNAFNLEGRKILLVVTRKT